MVSTLTSQPATVVTAASGFIGRHLMPRLLSDPNRKVRAVVLAGEEDRFEGPNLEVVGGDLLEPEFARQVVRPGDSLVNLLHIPPEFCRDYQAENARATDNLIAAAAENRPELIVHVSTVSVIGRPPAGLVDEDVPLRPEDDYGRVKLVAEEKFLGLARETGLPVIILRLAEVFGQGGLGLNRPVDELTAGPSWKTALRVFLLGARRTHYVHVSKVVEAIDFVLTEAGRPAEPLILNVADDVPDNNYRTIAEIILKTHGIKVPPVLGTVPPVVLDFVFRLVGRPVESAAIFSNHRLLASGFKFKTEFKEDLRRHLNWYKEYGRRT